MFTLLFTTCLNSVGCTHTPFGEYPSYLACLKAGNAYVQAAPDTYGNFTDRLTIKYDDESKAVFFDKANGILIKFTCEEKK